MATKTIAVYLKQTEKEILEGKGGREKWPLIFNRECSCSLLLAPEPYTTRRPVTNTHVSTVVRFVLVSCGEDCTVRFCRIDKWWVPLDATILVLSVVLLSRRPSNTCWIFSFFLFVCVNLLGERC